MVTVVFFCCFFFSSISLQLFDHQLCPNEGWHENQLEHNQASTPCLCFSLFFNVSVAKWNNSFQENVNISNCATFRYCLASCVYMNVLHPDSPQGMFWQKKHSPSRNMRPWIQEATAGLNYVCKTPSSDRMLLEQEAFWTTSSKKKNIESAWRWRGRVGGSGPLPL